MQQIVHRFLFLMVTGMFSGQVMLAQPVIAVADTTVAEVFSIDLSDSFLDLEMKTQITNRSDSTIQLKWNRLELDKPGEWDTQVCDNVECYIPLVSSNIDPDLGLDAPVVLQPDSSMDMILYVLPNGTPGSGRIELDISLASEPDQILQTIVYLPDVREEIVADVDDLLAPDFRIYPNPTTDFFELSSHQGIDEIVITNVLGRHIATYPAIPGQRYAMVQYPDGIYMVSLVNRQYGIIRTLRIAKRGIRP